MPSYNAIVKSLAANVPNAAAGKVNLFVDLGDSILKGRDEFGALEVYSAAVASALANLSANPTLLSAGLEPTVVGHVLAVTTVGPPHAGGFVDPRAAGVSRTTRVMRAAVTASTTAFIDEFLPVDLDAAAGDVTVSLPQITGPLIDREIFVKIATDGFPVNGRKVILAPFVGDNVDGLIAGGGGFLELATNYEWRILRAAVGSTWYVVG